MHRPCIGIRGGATVMAVLIVLSIVCLLAHQTVRTLFLLRQGQSYSAKIAQAQEVLELGRQLERQLEGNIDRLISGPVIVEIGQEYAKLVFSVEQPPTPEEMGTSGTADGRDRESEKKVPEASTGARRQSSTRISATWPVDSLGKEFPNQVPIVVTWESTSN